MYVRRVMGCFLIKMEERGIEGEIDRTREWEEERKGRISEMKN